MTSLSVLLLLVFACVHVSCDKSFVKDLNNLLRLLKYDRFIRGSQEDNLVPQNKYHDDIRRSFIYDYADDKKAEIYDFDQKLSDVISSRKLVDDDDDDDEQESLNNLSDTSETVILSLKMPQISPKQPDSYVCIARVLPNDDRYLVEFVPKASMHIAHHMLLFGCSDDEPLEIKKTWQCGEMQPVCNGGSQSILYAWGKNAPPLKMPENVGFHVGGNSNVRYLVLQIHYLDVSSFQDGHTDSSGILFGITSLRKQYHAGIYFLGDGYTSIPPHTEKFNINMGCSYPIDSPQLFPFRFRVHAHKLSTSITGYRIRNGVWTLIGHGDPQRPQAFYRVFSDIDIRPGDELVGRCTYNSTSQEKVTRIGATHNDEMCNFYMMYFYDSTKYGNKPSIPCDWLNTKKYKYPIDSDTPLSVIEARSNNRETKAYEFVENQYAHDETWNSEILDVGQVSGVDVDYEDVVIFHRANRAWDENTFDPLTQQINASLYKPIAKDTLVWLSRKTGQFVKSGGADMFLMPHGVTVDDARNIWVTDVGAHQVFKLSPTLEVLLTLGERYTPGNDYDHFCKPTDVAVMKDGSFFVADGYCNSRILKFFANGTVDRQISKKLSSNYLTKIGNFPKPFFMVVVHGLALDEAHNLLYVADRENGRILVFDSQSGDFITHISKKFEGAVFAIAYNENNGGVLHVVNGKSMTAPNVKVSGFTYSTDLHTIVSDWHPKNGFGMPHDIAVTQDNRDIFVAEINPFKIRKFSKVNKNLLYPALIY